MFGKKDEKQFKYPGTRMAMDGNSAVIMCEREASDAAGAYPITPSTQMGEYWAEEVANGHLNISGNPLIFVEPESEHAAAAVTAGMSMTGLRATNFSSAQGVAFMHESLYTAVGKRLPYVLNIGSRAITKASLNVHCAHDDYHCIDDTGFFQVFGKNAQEAADLNLIARKIAELTLTPAYDICPQGRAGNEATQAMLITGANRWSQLKTCLAAAHHFLLSRSAALEAMDRIEAAIRDHWERVCAEAELSQVDTNALWGRQFLNPFSLER